MNRPSTSTDTAFERFLHRVAGRRLGSRHRVQGLYPCPEDQDTGAGAPGGAVRLRGCLPWVKALLERWLRGDAAALIQGSLRVVVDGATVQGPRARGIGYRLHIAVDWVKLHLIHVEVSDQHPGEHWGYYPLQAGDVVLVDRASNQAQRLIEKADEGVSVVLRYNPHSLNV